MCDNRGGGGHVDQSAEDSAGQARKFFSACACLSPTMDAETIRLFTDRPNLNPTCVCACVGVHPGGPLVWLAKVNLRRSNRSRLCCVPQVDRPTLGPRGLCFVPFSCLKLLVKGPSRPSAVTDTSKLVL